MADEAWNGVLRFGRARQTWLGKARRGLVRLGRADMVRHASMR